MATAGLNAVKATRGGERRVLWIVGVSWTLAIFAMTYWWLDERLQSHQSQAAATGAVRLNGVKDTLSISLRQLAALPLDLSHRTSVPAFIAAQRSGTDTAPNPDIQQTLDRMSADFGLPLVALIDRVGTMVASSSIAVRPGSGAAINLTTREYYADAMKNGSGLQFLFGRASRAPGLYFASRVLHDGLPVGVAIVKQDTETFNRLLSDADGARVFVTDTNGVIVLANHRDMLMRRLPGLLALPEALVQNVYQRPLEPLAWEQSRLGEGPHAALVTRYDDLRHITLSSPLGDTPFRVWVLEPLDEEAQIMRSAWTGGLTLWVLGSLLIWLTWRRTQALDAALAARRDTYELTQALAADGLPLHPADTRRAPLHLHRAWRGGAVRRLGGQVRARPAAGLAHGRHRRPPADPPARIPGRKRPGRRRHLVGDGRQQPPSSRRTAAPPTTATGSTSPCGARPRRASRRCLNTPRPATCSSTPSTA